MKKRNYTLALLFAMLVITQLNANNYVWLHGLNDNYNCWKVYDNAFTPGISSRPGYSSNNSIANIANSVWNNNYLSYRSDIILIGHSLGGLIAREIESKKYSNVKAIITIGTPHQGAYVENAIAQGKQHEFVSSLSNKFAIGLSASTAALVGPFWPVQAGVIVVIDGTIMVVTNKVLVPYIESQMADGSLQSEKDMQVGSTYMNTASARKVNVPILCFAAEEDRWSVARLAYCASNKDKLNSDATLNSDGSYDKTGYNYLQAAQTGCYTLSGIHAGCAAGALALGWWNPWGWWAAGVNTAAGIYWLTTGNYLNNGLDYDYSVLLGSYAYEQRSYCYQKMVCPQAPLPYEPVKGKQNIIAPPTYSTDDCYYETVCETRTVAIPCAHDGTVSTYTQQLDKSKGTNVIWATSTIKGVNHMEEFNHYKTRKEFDDVLNGRSYLPTTFRK